MEAVDRRADVNHQPAAVLPCQQSPRQRSGSTNGINGDGTANLTALPGARGRINASAGGTDCAYSTRRGFPWRLPEHRR
jgi:hypothetical protein